MNQQVDRDATSVPARPLELRPLTSIRFFAAMHIFLFHVYEGHRMQKEIGQGLSLPILDWLPQPCIQFLRHGYCSTSLFFLISGFILTYLYVDEGGQRTKSTRAFLVARLTRIYPIHLVLLVLISPIAVAMALQMHGSAFSVVASGLLSTLLLQAWFPPYALSWNFPSWALSVVVFFYLVFPLCTGIARRLSRRGQWLLLAALPAVSLVPSLVYLAINDWEETPMSFGHELVMRTPLFWLPHFMMGLLLARVNGITRSTGTWRRPSRCRPSWGDAAAAALLAIFALPDFVPHLILRHGLLAPLYLVLLYELSVGHGLMARLLGSERLRKLGDASFSIFMWQFPMLIVGVGLAQARLPSALLLVVLVVATVAVSLASTRWIERPISRRLRAAWL